MALEVRTVAGEDLETLSRLLALAFGNDVGRWRDYFDPGKNPRVDPESVYVLEEDGEVRATATVLPLEAYVEGRAVPVGGVAAVAAHPAYRRRGYAGELVREALRRMRAGGVALSMLWPFAHAFYRSFGYELAGEAIEYRLEPGKLPTSPEQRNVRACCEEDLVRMMGLHEEAAARHRLCVRRGRAYWERLLGREEVEAAVYEQGDELEGYMLYETSPFEPAREPRRTMRVRELVWRTPQALAGLLSLPASLDPEVFGVRMWSPRGEPLHPYLRSSYVEARVSPEQMLRIVDVRGALDLLRPRGSRSLALDVRDELFPENEGEHVVGEGEIAGRVTLDVRRLAQLYAGYLPARDLARRGLIEPDTERALEVLEEIFPVRDPWVFRPDHF
ncbi:MAG: GNAT family N-acetyltransferase [Rubrobacteraceae bacterium]|nr:GNAT family N-acetyltransferase [Rubrobacteraceae bacterium]